MPGTPLQPEKTFRWPVTGEQSIAAPAEAVWAAISRPGNLELCHPFCASNPVVRWPGPESLDEIQYLSGWVYEREFKNWIDGVGYDLVIGRRGGGKSQVSWRIIPAGTDHCSLRITVCPHALQGIPVALRWVPHWLRLRPQLRQYLASVVRGFEWYVTKGEPVPRNAFGRHSWFSQPGNEVAR